MTIDEWRMTNGFALGAVFIRHSKLVIRHLPAAVVWTFFWWQEGQNQRRPKASRYSWRQWSQRRRAKPRSRLPQSRNLWTTRGMTGRRGPSRGEPNDEGRIMNVELGIGVTVGGSPGILHSTFACGGGRTARGASGAGCGCDGFAWCSFTRWRRNPGSKDHEEGRSGADHFYPRQEKHKEGRATTVGWAARWPRWGFPIPLCGTRARSRRWPPRHRMSGDISRSACRCSRARWSPSFSLSARQGTS